jgi:hypothetical protein
MHAPVILSVNVPERQAHIFEGRIANVHVDALPWQEDSYGTQRTLLRIADRQREEHYRAMIGQLEDKIEALQSENSDLRVQVDTLGSREGEVHRLQEECARMRLELVSCISDKEQALKNSKGALYEPISYSLLQCLCT